MESNEKNKKTTSNAEVRSRIFWHKKKAVIYHPTLSRVGITYVYN